MNNMNRVCILLCFCLAILAKESVADKNNHKNVTYMVSVREYPLFLHKCSATFVKSNVLVTSASCLICSNKCKLFVKILKDHLEQPHDTVQVVNRVVIHPQYEQNPNDYDIGIIILPTKMFNIREIQLPPISMNPFGVPSNIHTWHFKPDMKEYLFYTIKAKTISNELCSIYLHRFVPAKHLCVLGNQTMNFGPFDLGSPAIGKEKYLLGIFGMPGVIENSKVMPYNSIFPVLPWLKDIVDHKAYVTTSEASSNSSGSNTSYNFDDSEDF